MEKLRAVPSCVGGGLRVAPGSQGVSAALTPDLFAAGSVSPRTTTLPVAPHIADFAEVCLAGGARGQTVRWKGSPPPHPTSITSFASLLRRARLSCYLRVEQPPLRRGYWPVSPHGHRVLAHGLPRTTRDTRHLLFVGGPRQATPPLQNELTPPGLPGLGNQDETSLSGAKATNFSVAERVDAPSPPPLVAYMPDPQAFARSV